MAIYIDKNYYKILGVERNSSIDSIIKAYYRELFQNPYISYYEKDKLTEAYKVLSDQQKRKEYDKFLDSSKNDNLEVFLNDTDKTLSPQNLDKGINEKETNESILNDSNTKTDILSDLPKEEPIFHDIESIDKNHSYLTYNNAKNLGYVGKDNVPYISPLDEHIEETLSNIYDEKLKQNINKLINNDYKNYYLEISKLKCENQIELTKKIIEFKNNQKINSDRLQERQLEKDNLYKELSVLEQRLQELNEKIKNYDKETNLTKINKKISEIEKDIDFEEQKISFNFLTIKKLELKKKYYELRQKVSFNGVKLINGFVSRTVNGISYNYNIGKEFVTNIADNIKENYIDSNQFTEQISMHR